MKKYRRSVSALVHHSESGEFCHEVFKTRVPKASRIAARIADDVIASQLEMLESRISPRFVSVTGPSRYLR